MKPDLMIAVGDQPTGAGAAGESGDQGALAAAANGEPKVGLPGSRSVGEQCVPLAALAMPDDKEQLESPEVGDRVQYQVEGAITRIEGKMAYVQPASVNGKDVSEEEEGPEEDAAEGEQTEQPAEGSGPTYADLEKAAQEQGGL